MFDAAALSRLAVEASVLSSGPVAAYLYGRGRYGAGPRSGTLGFTVLAVTQLLHVLSARSETHSIFDRAPLASNRYVPMAVGGGVALQVLATFVPGLRRVLGVVPLGLVDWGIVGVAAVGPLIANESIKVALRGAAVGQRR
jgi:Ca2+-transporting ATPase